MTGDFTTNPSETRRFTCPRLCSSMVVVGCLTDTSRTPTLDGFEAAREPDGSRGQASVARPDSRSLDTGPAPYWSGRSPSATPANITGDINLGLAYDRSDSANLFHNAAYTTALHTAPPTAVTIYPYVNTVVAMALGWLILDEAFPAHLVLGAALILASLLAVTFQTTNR